MKNFVISVLVILIFVSCKRDEKLEDFENRISNIENKNEILSDSIHLLKAQFIEPFKLYEELVLFELKRSPSQSIRDYEFLMREYSGSFWAHEAKKRIENIKTRSKYWSEEKGWKLPKRVKDFETNEIIETTIISCPGC